VAMLCPLLTFLLPSPLHSWASTPFPFPVSSFSSFAPPPPLIGSARQLRKLVFKWGMCHISTALYFYGASKKSPHKPRATFENILFW
jgi:hypothetical protein